MSGMPGNMPLRSKRRKTRSLTAAMAQGMQDKLISPGIKLTVKAVAPSFHWPAGTVPLEVFGLITSYLPRSDIQNMRLVNKEFETKVSQYLFKVVVLPFRPQMYDIGIKDMRDLDPATLQSQGIKIFQGFGSRVKKFAMSFEVDMDQLIYPPIKSNQEQLKTWWGDYMWPDKKYARYDQIRGLEQVACETGTLTQALRHLKNATELGLSIDGGLGWLAGPDINQNVFKRHEKLRVFGKSKFLPEEVVHPVLPKELDLVELAKQLLADMDTTKPAVRAMLRLAGYNGSALKRQITAMLRPNGYLERLAGGKKIKKLLDVNWNLLSRALTQRDQLRTAYRAETPDDDEPHHNVVVPIFVPSLGEEVHTVEEDGEDSGDDEKHKYVFPLRPIKLTSAQRELLLEIEWAQRAFMLSYAIAIMDNKATFQNVQVLTIARLPSRHLPQLSRPDFWDSLPGLKFLSLAIIPDWRELTTDASGTIPDVKVLPSEAVAVVYTLLKEHILHRKNIESLHLEWLSGGEEAPGLFARNQHILPAPLTPSAMEMLVRSQVPAPILSFPYLKHLSLKNCWITPHILARFTLGLPCSFLESITFNSVSLTAHVRCEQNIVPMPSGRPAVHAQALVDNAIREASMSFEDWIPLANAVVGVAVGLGWFHMAQPPVVLAPLPPPRALRPHGIDRGTGMPNWLMRIRYGSWAHFINLLTPGQTLAELRCALGLDTEPPARIESSIKKLTFESCGYVRLPLRFDQSELDPIRLPPHEIKKRLATRIEDMRDVMLVSGSDAKAAIMDHMSKMEQETLVIGFGMTLGWDSSRSALRSDAKLDGIREPGRGRFSGTIEEVPPEETENGIIDAGSQVEDDAESDTSSFYSLDTETWCSSHL